MKDLQERLADVRRIWVRSPNWLGDAVMAGAAFGRLRAAFPKAHITAGMRPYLRPLLRNAGWFDEVVDALPAGGPGGLLRQVGAMRAARYDLAVVLPHSIETGLVPRLAGVPLRLGYRHGRPGLMNLGLRRPRERRPFSRQGPRFVPEPMPEHYRKLLDVLGIPGDALRARLPVHDEESLAVDAWLAARGLDPDVPLALLTPGASYGASKLWLPERFAAVGRRLRDELGLVPIFLSGPNEVAMVADIAAQADALAANDPVLPLDVLKALVARCRLMVTTDTGPRHLAVAFDKPIVCLMGPNDPRYTNYLMERTALIRKELPCSPCQRKVCPLGHQDCMRLIEVDEVVAAAQRVLATPPSAA